MTIQTILTILLSFTWSSDDPPDQRFVRGATMAVAVHEEAQSARGPLKPKQLVAGTLAMWKHESAFDVGIHAGSRGRWGSDVGKAKCMGQLHRTGLMTEQEWRGSTGLDLAPTRMCARLTMRVLQTMARHCRFDGTDAAWHRVFSAYGTGKGCALVPKLRKRVKTVREIERRLGK